MQQQVVFADGSLVPQVPTDLSWQGRVGHWDEPIPWNGKHECAASQAHANPPREHATTIFPCELFLLILKQFCVLYIFWKKGLFFNKLTVTVAIFRNYFSFVSLYLWVRGYSFTYG